MLTMFINKNNELSGKSQQEKNFMVLGRFVMIMIHAGEVSPWLQLPSASSATPSVRTTVITLLNALASSVQVLMEQCLHYGRRDGWYCL